MLRHRFAVRLAMVCFGVGAAVTSVSGMAAAESGDGYLHNLNAPPLCAFPWETPDPSVPICQARFFAPRLALTSQSVILRIGDVESSQADCEAYSSGVTTTFKVDGGSVPVTTIPCRYTPMTPDNLTAFGPLWRTDYRFLIPAGSLAVGVHTVTWTATYNVDITFSLGCTDPSGRCTTPAGTVVTATAELTINGP